MASVLLFLFLTPDFLLPLERPATILVVASCLLSLASSSVGALVTSRRPSNPVGWIFLGMGLLYGVRRLAEAYADYALLARPGSPLGEVAAWASTWLRLSPLIALGVLLALLFPDGRLPSTRWRTVAFAAGGGALLVVLGDAFRFGPLPTYYYVSNPFGVGRTGGGVFSTNALTETSTIVGGALLAACCFVSVFALRLRRVRGPERRRPGWFEYAAIPALLVSAAVLLNWSLERFGAFVLGKTLTPGLAVAEMSVFFAKAGQTAGTLSELRLDTNLELFSSCAILTMPIFAFVAMRRHGFYGMEGATPLAVAGWLRAFVGGAIAGATPLAFVYLAVFLYVVFYPLAWRGEMGQEQLGRVVAFVSSWGAQAFFFAVTFLVAIKVARQTEKRAVVLGTLVGLLAAFVDRTITSVLDPPVAWGAAASYLSLGLAGRSNLSGDVYLVSQRIGTAKDASAVAAAIGENLGDARAEGVAVWSRDTAGEQIPTDDSPRPQIALLGSWRADGREDWPRSRSVIFRRTIMILNFMGADGVHAWHPSLPMGAMREGGCVHGQAMTSS